VKVFSEVARDLRQVAIHDSKGPALPRLNCSPLSVLMLLLHSKGRQKLSINISAMDIARGQKPPRAGAVVNVPI